ncbi:MAG TPA: hypothetical protein ENK02_10280 [Planctomycetes bacterium]|nr:hypothetical protein [Planctomycetota bacterium]
MFLYFLLPLLLAQSCTIMLWKTLPEDLRDEDHSFVINTQVSAFTAKEGPKERYHLVLKLNSNEADQLPGAWRYGRILLEGSDHPEHILLLLNHLPRGWVLRSIDLRLESWWEGLSRILSTDATLTLRGTLPTQAYARLLDQKEVAPWLEKDPALKLPSGPGIEPLGGALRLFEEDSPPPGFIGKGTPYWDPVGFVDDKGRRVPLGRLVTAMAKAQEEGRVFLGTGFYLRGRIQMGLEPLYKEVPLTFLLLGKGLTVDPLPNLGSYRWIWVKRCSARPDTDPGTPRGLPPGLDRIIVSWVHHRAVRASLFWPITLRVLATPITIAADLIGGIFIGALASWGLSEESNDDAYHHYYHHP